MFKYHKLKFWTNYMQQSNTVALKPNSRKEMEYGAAILFYISSFILVMGKPTLAHSIDGSIPDQKTFHNQGALKFADQSFSAPRNSMNGGFWDSEISKFLVRLLSVCGPFACRHVRTYKRVWKGRASTRPESQAGLATLRISTV